MVKKIGKKKRGIKRKGKAKGGFFSLPLMQKRTGMNRDIPLGSGGGSPNLLASLARQAPPQVIQTPDQFNIQQDIKQIKVGQAQQQAEAEKMKAEAERPLTKAERDAIFAEDPNATLYLRRRAGQPARLYKSPMGTPESPTRAQENMQSPPQATTSQTAPQRPQAKFPQAKSAGGARQETPLKKKLAESSGSSSESSKYPSSNYDSSSASEVSMIPDR